MNEIKVSSRHLPEPTFPCRTRSPHRLTSQGSSAVTCSQCGACVPNLPATRQPVDVARRHCIAVWGASEGLQLFVYSSKPAGQHGLSFAHETFVKGPACVSVSSILNGPFIHEIKAPFVCATSGMLSATGFVMLGRT